MVQTRATARQKKGCPYVSQTLMELLPALEQWYGDEIAELDGRLPDKGNGLLLACPLWGARYAQRFARYCLPSLLAPNNLAALRDHCRIVLFTDKPTRPYLKEVVRGLDLDAGLQIIFRTIPDAIMDAIDNQPRGAVIDNKYWALGIAGQVGMKMAGVAGMAFHQFHPDHVYADSYFLNLMRLAHEHEAIAQPGISATLPQAHDELYKWKQPDGTLAIPDRDLGDIGFRLLHPQTAASLITDERIPDDLPLMHLWTWQGKDRLYLSCCHMNAAYLSARRCAMAPSRIPATVDAELPSFFPREFYVPKADDGLTYIELSDATKPADTRRGTLAEFVACCAEKVAFQNYWEPYTKELYEIPIHEQETFADEAKVREQHAWLLEQLREENPTPKARAAYALINQLRFRHG